MSSTIYKNKWFPRSQSFQKISPKNLFLVLDKKDPHLKLCRMERKTWKITSQTARTCAKKKGRTRWNWTNKILWFFSSETSRCYVRIFQGRSSSIFPWVNLRPNKFHPKKRHTTKIPGFLLSENYSKKGTESTLHRGIDPRHSKTPPLSHHPGPKRAYNAASQEEDIQRN